MRGTPTGVIAVHGMSGSGRRRAGAAGAGLAGLLLVLAGCSDEEPGDLPAFSATPSASADATADVEAAYRGYTKATETLAASGDPDPAVLRPYATPELAQKDAETFALLFDQDFRMVGSMGVDVREVTVTGDSARLEACLDTTTWVTVKAGEEPDPTETGQPAGIAVVDVVQQGGKWLVSATKAGGSC